MKEKLYIVKTRYEYRGTDGIDWTNWFVLERNYMTEKEAKEYIKNIKNLYADIDKKTKLKHDYMIVPSEDFEKEQKEVENFIKAAKKRDDKYFASDEWKELKHKKYVSRKERKAKQEEYLEMQKQLENNQQ